MGGMLDTPPSSPHPHVAFERACEMTSLCSTLTATFLCSGVFCCSFFIFTVEGLLMPGRWHSFPLSSHEPALDKCRCSLTFPSCSV